MADIKYEGHCCVDCLMVMANDDWTGIEDASRVEEVREGFARLEGHAYATDDYDEFSWSSCDVCGTRLGGARQSFVVIGS